MKLRKKLNKHAAKLMVGAGTLCLVLSALLAYQPSARPDYSRSVVRIHTADGHFTCSGMVVSKHRIITAAHCVPGSLEEFFGVEAKPVTFEIRDSSDTKLEEFFGVEAKPVTFEIRDSSDTKSDIKATVLAKNRRADLAILEGNFSAYEPVQIQQSPQSVLEQMRAGRLTACGYPWAGNLWCTRMTNAHVWNFGFKVKGALYPGMSGGPVFNETTGEVIALVTAGADDEMYISPLTEILAALDVQPEAK